MGVVGVVHSAAVDRKVRGVVPINLIDNQFIHQSFITPKSFFDDLQG